MLCLPDTLSRDSINDARQVKTFLIAMLLAFNILACRSTYAAAAENASAPDWSSSAWTLFYPDPGAPVVEARLMGNVTAGQDTEDAGLHISCRSGLPRVTIGLQLDAESLKLNVSAFEGPSASAHGPITAKLENNPPTRYPVTGSYAAPASVFRQGDIFEFSFISAAPSVLRWADDAARGHSLDFALYSGKSSKPWVTAKFRLPQNDRVLRSTIAGCLKR